MVFKKTKYLVLVVFFVFGQFNFNKAQSSFDQEKDVGDSVTLRCSLTDKYESEVSWRKSDGVVKKYLFLLLNYLDIIR